MANNIETKRHLGITRRDLLKKGALVIGTAMIGESAVDAALQVVNVNRQVKRVYPDPNPEQVNADNERYLEYGHVFQQKINEGDYAEVQKEGQSDEYRKILARKTDEATLKATQADYRRTLFEEHGYLPDTHLGHGKLDAILLVAGVATAVRSYISLKEKK